MIGAWDSVSEVGVYAEVWGKSEIGRIFLLAWARGLLSPYNTQCSYFLIPVFFSLISRAIPIGLF